MVSMEWNGCGGELGAIAFILIHSPQCRHTRDFDLILGLGLDSRSATSARGMYICSFTLRSTYAS